MPDLTQYEYDIFLSHSTADREWVERLALCLEQAEWDGRKIRVFFSPWEIRPGEDIAEAIQRGIARSRYVGIVMSPDAMKSPYVKGELKLTLDMIYRGEKSEDALIPILRRACDPSTVPGELRRRCRINATGPDALEKTCRKLIAVIKGEPLKDVVSRFLSPSGDIVTPFDFIPPPSPYGFFPRHNSENQNVLDLVRAEIAPGKNQLVAIWGPGGMGKTTLAATLARRMYNAFKSRVMWINGNEDKNFDLSTMLDLIATRLGEGDFRAYSLDQKKVEIRKLIDPEPLLIVLDNFETIKPDEQKECLEWLKKGVSCSVLITTREKIDDDSVINIYIGKLSRNNARKFLDGIFGEEDAEEDDENE